MSNTDVDNLFRHTSLSMLSSVGWKPELLRRHADQKNIYTNLNTYVPLSEEEVTEAGREAVGRFRLPGKGAEE